MTTFHLYASQNDIDITSVLGKPDYSYWFVQSYFQRALQRLGETHIVKSLVTDLPTIDNNENFLLAFMPPHKVPHQIVESAVTVFAWEYDTIPDEGWGGEQRNDWYWVMNRAPGAITFCDATVETVKERLGHEYPIASVHVPVWDEYSSCKVHKPVQAWSLAGRGVVIDSRYSADSSTPTSAADFHVMLDGVVYTSVFNPNDGRKEWVDMVSAFVAAHRHTRDATLILKLIQAGSNDAATTVYEVAAALGDFECRVVVIQGHLDDESYRKLCSWSTFAVNSSRGEGQCLPLLEAMSAGVPAVAPDHTAMADYVRPDNSFVVKHTRKRTSWSHDPRTKYTCFTYPVVWESLRDTFIESYTMVRSHPDAYLTMCEASASTTRDICSAEVVDAQLTRFFDDVRARAERRPRGLRDPASPLD